MACRMKLDRHKQNNIPQFSTECAVQENENINPYMAEADFDEKAFDMIGPNTPRDVKDAWMEAAKDVNANGMGIKKNGEPVKFTEDAMGEMAEIMGLVMNAFLLR